MQVFDWQTFLATSAFWLPIVALLLYFIKNPEKVEKWYSIIARSLSWISLRLEKSGVAKDIQSDINSFAKNIDSRTSKHVVPYGVKIKWISGTTRQVFVKNSRVVVKMQHHQNQAKNFLYALLEWVNKGLIPESRHLIDKTVLRAVEFAFINKVLTEKKRFDTRQLFLDGVFEPEATKGSLLERYTSIFNKLDRRGEFVGIVLHEFSSLGRREGTTISDKEIRSETIGFTNMLEKLSRKQSKKDATPDYNAVHIKCSIVLIARPENYLMYGLSPYLNWINKCCTKGIKSFYVCAIGDTNISIVRKIRDAYQESKRVSVVSETIESIDSKRTMVLYLKAKKPIQNLASPTRS